MGQDDWSDAHDELDVELGREPTDEEIDLRIEDNEADRIEGMVERARERI